MTLPLESVMLVPTSVRFLLVGRWAWLGTEQGLHVAGMIGRH